MERSRDAGYQQKRNGTFIRNAKSLALKIGEVLRKHGLYSSDLQLIRREIKEAALERLSRSRPGRQKATVVPVEERDQLKRELEEKEKALVELSVMFTTLQKKVNSE